MKEQLKNGIKTVSSDQLFTTPPDIAERMADMLNIDKCSHILEPSAGTGALIDAVWNRGGRITACEINPQLSQALESKVSKNYNCDFLDIPRQEEFDAVIMNPPFKNALDIKHIKHAFSMLKKGGQLMAICANGPRQRKVFKNVILYEPLLEGTFKNAGTMVNTALAYMEKKY